MAPSTVQRLSVVYRGRAHLCTPRLLTSNSPYRMSNASRAKRCTNMTPTQCRQNAGVEHQVSIGLTDYHRMPDGHHFKKPSWLPLKRDTAPQLIILLSLHRFPLLAAVTRSLASRVARRRLPLVPYPATCQRRDQATRARCCGYAWAKGGGARGGARWKGSSLAGRG